MAIKIDPVSPKPVSSNRRVGGSGSAGGGGEFAKALGESQGGQGHHVSMAFSVNSLSVVLAVQETPDAVQSRARKRARDRGLQMLDFLDEIRAGLLMGAIPKDRLEQLAQMVRAKREQIDDPKLTAILDEIELRAAVELAKLSR
ncbi:flagellar assembly protein FliX [Dongia sp.]|uniref:flagellar assembly protein FliX n=1 Tax=Dongia sp. TaxID=1977262 RepID=UPI0035B0689E